MDIDALKGTLSFSRSAACKLVVGRKIIAHRLYGAKTPSEQARGLMFRKLQEKEALLFFMSRPQRFSLHMLFVFSPIDVVFCDHHDDGFIIREVKQNFRPFSTYKARCKTDLFIELPLNGASGLHVDDVLVPKDI